MATESSSPPPHLIPLPPPNLEASICELRELSTALSTFQRRYDELQQHLDFIDTTINSKLPNPLPTLPSTNTQSSPSKSPIPTSPTIPNPQQITVLPNSEQKTEPSVKVDTSSPINSPPPKIPDSPAHLLNSEQNHIDTGKPIISEASVPTKPVISEASVPTKPVDKLSDTTAPKTANPNGADAKAKPMLSELEKLCSAMCSRGLRRYFTDNISELDRLRVEAPKALKYAPDPAKLVLETLGRFFLQGKKAFEKKSPMLASREASIFALECFLLMESDGVMIKDMEKEEAKAAAIAWRKRLHGEGGLTKACEADSRGLLFLIACFGVPDTFNGEDIRILIRSSNPKGISGVLRRSKLLVAKIPEIVVEMLKNKKEIEAVDIVYTFEVQDRFPPQTILSSFLSRSNEIWKRKRKETEDSVDALDEDKKHLAHLKYVAKCLEDNEIDPSKAFPELEINEKISSLEKEIAALDKSLKEKMTTMKKADEAESSKKLKTRDVKKRSRVAGNDSRPQKKANGEADGKSPYDRLAQVNLSGGIPRGSGAGAGLLHEYASAARAGSVGGLVATGIGGGIPAAAGTILAPDPYAVSQRGMLVETDLYNGHLYGWRGDAAANERLISRTYSGQPSSVGYNGHYRPSPSLEGFAGLPDRPFATGPSRGSGSDLYHFADSVLESELQRNSASRPGVPPHNKSPFLY